MVFFCVSGMSVQTSEVCKIEWSLLYRKYATSFLNFSVQGYTTSPCFNGYHDLVVYNITLMFTLSREIIFNILV